MGRRSYSAPGGRPQESEPAVAMPAIAEPVIIGESPAMQDILRAITHLAGFPITVLINGESGTGKELIARALHRYSPRAAQPFVALNMAAIPHHLIESELFGHEKGAFTGAQTRRPGLFRQAHGGTLFLDEIGDMPMDLQTRLLRVLADGEFFPVGAHVSTRVDVRIIAATHQNLDALVACGRFREDLYHRLNVIRIALPPLRKRREDIPPLLRYLLRKVGRELLVEPKTPSPALEACLCRLDWPGNVRQLENLCRWITVMVPRKEIRPEDLPPELLPAVTEPVAVSEAWEDPFRHWVDRHLQQGECNLARKAIESAEAILINTALRATRGHRQEAARLLGYGRNTLTRKIAELNLDV